MRAPRTVLVAMLCVSLLFGAGVPLAFAVPRATGDPAASAGPALTAGEMRAKGPQAMRALAGLAPEIPAQSVSGTVTYSGGYPEDAAVFAVAFVYDPYSGEWLVMDGAEVAADGSYQLGLWEPGTYRIGFWDFALVYAERYWPAAATLETATDVVVGPGDRVTGIDVTLEALPELIISGRVGFDSAPPPRHAVWISAWESDGPEWYPVNATLMKEDRTYRLHLPEPGTYRVCFTDFSMAYSEVFYLDASDVSVATDVTLPGVPAHITGIDQTMSVAPSARYAGADRYGTSAALSRAAFEDGWGGGVVMVTGETWPDALCAAPYAADRFAPVLLTRRDSIPMDILEEIARLEPYEVVIIGGYGAVGLDTEITLRTLLGVPVVRRIFGHDRYETSALVAGEMASQRGSAVETAALVSGERFADALSVGPIAAANGWPVVLTRRGALPAPTERFFLRNEVGSLLVAGGEAVVGEDVLLGLPEHVRVAGADRYGTAVALADWGDANGMIGSNVYGLASGERFADGVCAGLYLGLYWRPLLLTRRDRLPGATGGLLDRRSGTIARVELFGGPAAVSDAVFEEALDRAGL